MLPQPILQNTNINPLQPSYSDFLEYKDYMISKGLALESTNVLIDKIQPQDKLNPKPVFYKYNPPSGTMYGSPYLAYLTSDSNLARAAQHSIPKTQYDRTLNNSYYVMIQFSAAATGDTFPDKAINGYTSVRFTRSWENVYILKIVYFDFDLNTTMQYNPSTNSKPEPFIF